MSRSHPLGPGWEADFEREWNQIFRVDSPNATIPRQTRTSYPFKLEDVVRAAIIVLRQELGKTWLPNRFFGTRLHAEVRRQIEKVTVSAGWQIEAEQPLRSIGGLSPRVLQLSVRQYLARDGQHLAWLRPQLSAQLDTKVADLEPDLFIRGPDGVGTIWDLTSREQEAHLAKTLLYATLLTTDNQLTRIGETYWLKFR